MEQRTIDARGRPPASTRRTEKIGRFTLLSEIWSDTGLKCHEAYDPHLDRKVDLVLVLGTAEQGLRERVLRDARAIARVHHPNVVEVHDVGTDRETVFVAINSSGRETLEHWSARTYSTKPAWLSGTLSILLQAGRAAVALLASDVGAFRLASNKVFISGQVEPWKAYLGGLFTDFSRSGTAKKVEQPTSSTSRDATAAFCFVAWEVLFRASFPAFTQETPPNRQAEEIRETLSQVLDQSGRKDDGGLTLERVLNELELSGGTAAPPTSRRTRGVALAVLSTTVAGLAYWAGRPSGECENASARLGAVWNEELSRETRNALLGTGLPHAKETWSRVDSGLRSYSKDWKTAWTDACLSANVRGELTPDQLGERRACLEEANDVVTAVAERLKAADAPVLARELELMRILPDVADCASRTGKASVEEQRLLRVVAEASVQRTIGAKDEAVSLTESAVGELKPETTPFVRSLVLLGHGRALAAASNPRSAIGPLTEAYATAYASNQSTIATQSAFELLALRVLLKSATESTRPWLELLRASTDSLSTEQLARIETLEVAGAHAQDDTASLHAWARRTAEIVGDDVGLFAELRRALADELRQAGRIEEAIHAAHQALDDQTSFVGDGHPSIAVFERTLAVCLLDADEVTKARALLESALRRVQDVWGDQSPESASYMAMLAKANCTESSSTPIGLAGATEAESLLPADHPTFERHYVLSILRTCARSVQPDRTVKVSAELLKTTEQIYGSDHQLSVLARANHVADLSHATFPNSEQMWREILRASTGATDNAPGWNFHDAVEIHRVLGGAARVLGEGDFALRQAELALSLLNREDTPSPWARTAVHVGLCRARRHVGDFTGALPACLEALETVEDDKPIFEAEVEHTAGELLRLLGRDHEAVEHGKRAVRILTEVGEAGPHSLWLAHAHSSVATAYEHIGQHSDAEFHYRSSFELVRTSRDPGRVHAGSGLVRMLGRTGHLDAARQLLTELDGMSAATDPYAQASLAEARGYLEHLEHPTKGSVQYKEALDFLRTTGSPSELRALCLRAPMRISECELMRREDD